MVFNVLSLGRIALYTAFIVFFLPQTLVKNLVQSLAKDLVKTLPRNVVRKIVRKLCKYTIKPLTKRLPKAPSQKQVNQSVYLALQKQQEHRKKKRIYEEPEINNIYQKRSNIAAANEHDTSKNHGTK